MEIGDYKFLPGATVGGSAAGALAGVALNEALNENPTLGSRIGYGLLGAGVGALAGGLGSMESKNPASRPEKENKRPLLKGLLAGLPISVGAGYLADRYISQPNARYEFLAAYNKARNELPKRLRGNNIGAITRTKARRMVALKRGKVAALAALAGIPLGAYVTLKNV